MEKTQNKKMFCGLSYIRDRLFYVILTWCMALFFMNGTVFGQAEQKKITMKVTDVTVLDALYEVNRLCGNLIFFMKEEVERENTLVSVDVENLSLLETVKKIIEGTSLACIEKNGRLIVAPAVQMPVTVCGFVTDQRKSPMPGATVMVKGLTLGTVTDSRGWYKLSVPQLKDFTLVFSFIGMKETEWKYAGKDTINITLYEDVQAMDEVVVTGYGNVSKGSYTGASTTVKASDVMMAGVSSIDQMLQGVEPGMLVMNKTGMVGASPKIRVRGTSTLLGSQEPVWVVDGVIQRDPQPFNSEDNTKFSVDADDIRQLAGNAVSWLNPNDIETITVLKDASATAIYGSQAANGVIVITTKKAKVGKISVNYNGDFSIGQRPRYGLYDLMNSAERMQLSKEIYEERREFTNGSVVLPIGYEGLLQKLFNKEITHEEMASGYEKMARQNTDWFDILFRNSFNHSHSLGISGGSEKIQNRTSFGFIQENGEAKGNGMTQFTASSNTTINLWDRVTINMLLNGSVREVDGFAYGVDPFNYAYNTSRTIPAYNEDGSLFYHEKQGEGSAAISNKSTYNYNILNERSTTGSESCTRNWGTTIDLKWQILPGLEYQGLVAYNSSSSDSKQHATERSFYISSIRGYEYGTVIENTSGVGVTPLPMGGVLETDLTNITTITVRNSLVYDRLFKEKHRMTLQFGVETNSVRTKGETNKRYGYMPDRGESFVAPPASYSSYGFVVDNVMYAQGSHSVLNRIENKLSEYATAVYTYDDRYVVNFSGRVDASNRFGQDKNKRFQPTWSAGLKWRITNEEFARKTWWLNNLDLYGSYGYQGNAVSSVSPELIAKDEYLMLYQAYALNIISLPYPDLGWEKTKTWNLGLDASFLDSRLNFTFNYFKKVSEILSSRNVAYENGVRNGIVSGSTLENHGYDFVINVIPVRVRDFTWQLSLNTSVTRNSVEKNNRVNGLEDYYTGSCVVNGRPFSTFYSYEFDGLEQEHGQPQFKHMNIEGAESPKDYLVESGKFTPDFSGGLNTMFKYKQFSLYALFTVQWGGHGRLPNLYTSNLNPPKPEQNVSKKLMNRWKRPGDKSLIPSLPGTGNELITLPLTATSPAYRAYIYDMYNYSDVRVANTDFIRCRSISLAYEFDGDWLKQVGINYLQLKASMTNPFMWVSDSKWDGLDPETGNWPARRVTSLSLQVMF